MPYQRLLCAVLMLPLLHSFHHEAAAQSPSRSKVSGEVAALKKQLHEKELLLLETSAEDRAAHAEFLKQPDTGLIRLMPRGRDENLLTLSGGGSYYSFTRKTHEYGSGSNLQLQVAPRQRRDDLLSESARRQDEFLALAQSRRREDEVELPEYTFLTGLAGADYGFIANLGKIPLDQVTLDHKGVKFLADYAPPSTLPEARAEARRGYAGVDQAGFNYKNRQPVVTGNTYLLRSINYRQSDVLVAFRAVRMDGDGSVVLLWKKLKGFSTPGL